jgi:MYXO-CTERM domain-containing protein
MVAALAGSASLVAALGPSCCACIPSGGAQTSGFMNRTAVNALFCAQAPPADPGDLSVQCQQENPDYTLDCVPDLPTLACASELADAGIACPTSGVPAATGSTALALAVVLGVAGALALRRRRRTDA